MLKIIMSTIILAHLLVNVSLRPTTAGAQYSHSSMIVADQQDCPTSNKPCGLPTKGAGEYAGCECFACNYGTPEQHLVCTKNETEKSKLRALVLKDKPDPVSH